MNVQNSISLDQDSVKGILAERKVMHISPISFKYIINQDPDRYAYHGIDEQGCALFEDLNPEITPWITPIHCPYGKVGDVLFVKEVWAETCDEYGAPIIVYKAGGKPIYLGADSESRGDSSRQDYLLMECNTQWSIDNYPSCGEWGAMSTLKPTLARIFIEITDVRCSRAQDITQEQAKDTGISTCPHRPSSEGCKPHADNSLKRDCYVCSFKFHLNSLKHKEAGAFKKNMWVWVISFKVLTTKGLGND